MSKYRSWFWQIKEMGQGPDYVFIARFAKSDAERLAAMVHQNLPSSYVYNSDFVYSNRCRDCNVYASYLDRHTFDRLTEMKKRKKQENIYYSGEIEVCDRQFRIENVLIGGMYDETDLVIAIAKAPDLTLQEWIVAYSGYSWGEVNRGSNAAELLTYLQYED
jgi:hypothetical protein